jgi:hypothetical protein
MDACHASAPKEPDADLVSALDQKLVQPDATHCDAVPSRKIRLRCATVSDKTNAAKRERLLGIDGDAQLAERLERIRHQAFAAGLIDGRLSGIRNDDVESFQAGGNRRR